MKASIELPIIEREILTWTNHEGINTPRSGRRHFNHQRSINSFNAFMNPQWKQEDIERISLSDYPELQEYFQYKSSSSSSTSSVEDVGRHQCIDYVHVSNIDKCFLCLCVFVIFYWMFTIHSNHTLHGLTIVIFKMKVGHVVKVGHVAKVGFQLQMMLPLIMRRMRRLLMLFTLYGFNLIAKNISV